MKKKPWREYAIEDKIFLVLVIAVVSPIVITLWIGAGMLLRSLLG